MGIYPVAIAAGGYGCIHSAVHQKVAVVMPTHHSISQQGHNHRNTHVYTGF